MSIMDFGEIPPAGEPLPVPEDNVPSLSSPPAGDSFDSLRQAIDLITSYMEQEQDDEDLAIAAKIKADIQKLLAQNQKLADSAMGMGPGEKFIRKQNAGY
jgi:hypothetical protein